MSAVTSLRRSLEEAVGTLPDLVPLIIGLAVVVYFIGPILGVTGQIKNLITGSGTATGTTSASTLQTTGTVGHVQSSDMLYGYGGSYTPIQKFFRQMITERQS